MSGIRCQVLGFYWRLEPDTFVVLLIPRFFVTREDFVPRASRPCSSMAGTAMARLWLRLCRTMYSVVNELVHACG